MVHSDAPPGEQLSKPAIVSGLGFVRRQYLIIVGCLLLTALVGAFHLVTTPPKYTASATIIIDPRKSQFLQQRLVSADVLLDTASINSAWFDSQIGILRLDSAKVASSVVRDLHLNRDPEFVGSDGGSEEPKSESELLQRAASVLASRLELKRVSASYLIRIEFSSPDPEQATRIANAVADAYVFEDVETKHEMSRRSNDWLQERLKTLHEQASSAEAAVVQFKTKNNIVAAGGRLMNDQQLSELNTQLVSARAHTADMEARLSRIETVLRGDHISATADATVSDPLNNPVIPNLRSQYVDLVSREADLSGRLGRNHLAVVSLRNQVREVRNTILDEFRRVAEIYRSEHTIAKDRQEAIEKRLAGVVSQSQEMNEAQIALRGLESGAQSYSTLYDIFLKQYTSSVQNQSFPISETRVVSPASGAFKSGPRISSVALAAIIGGLALGVGLGTLRESMDQVFRTRGQVQAILETECLALIPMVKCDRRSVSPDRQAIGEVQNSRTIRRKPSTSRTVIDAPFSRFAEAIRSIKLAADLNGGSNSTKVIGLTSCLPAEGKSTVATALAEQIAQVGARAILVDCDLRTASLSRFLAPTAAAGIIEVISGNKRLEEIIWNDPTTHMDFLPTVADSRLANTSQVLAGDAIKNLFGVLRLSYDYIIVDLSPLAPVIDVRATTEWVDSYILLVEWGRTRIDVAQHALQDAREIRKKMLGVVLNKVNVDAIGQYEGYRAKEFHSNNYFS
jgi:succinoglycan biosynthesis transport protein ExoP